MTSDSKVSDVEARERELFESRVKRAWPSLDVPENFYRRDLSDGSYVKRGMQERWEGWQLARANQQPSAQWIACSERVPSDGQDVWIFRPTAKHVRVIEAVWNGVEKCWDNADGDDYMNDFADASHWMPRSLPQSPDTMRKG